MIQDMSVYEHLLVKNKRTMQTQPFDQFYHQRNSVSVITEIAMKTVILSR